jgi:hypothetical protein
MIRFLCEDCVVCYVQWFVVYCIEMAHQNVFLVEFCKATFTSKDFVQLVVKPLYVPLEGAGVGELHVTCVAFEWLFLVLLVL